MCINKFIAYSDASVRDSEGYISFVIFDSEQKQIYSYGAKVRLTCSYTLEKLALALTIEKVDSLGIDKKDIEIITDVKGIYNNLQKSKENKMNRQFRLFFNEKSDRIFRTFKSCVKFANRRWNKAHELSRVDYKNYFDFNRAKIFL